MSVISIIIPAFNAEDYLPNCIDSILKQSFTDFEVVIIDDGSTDHTWKICEQYIVKDDRIQAFHQKNSGSVSARREGLMRAKGEYVAMIDADDWISEKRLEEFYSIIVRYKPDAIVASFTNVNANNFSSHKQYFETGFYTRENMENIIFPNLIATENHFTFGILPTLCGCCIKRELMEKNYIMVPRDISIGDDACITYPCILGASSLFISQESGYYYRTNDSSMTHTWNPNLFIHCQNLFSYLDTTIGTNKWNLEDQLKEYKAFITWFAVRKAVLSADKENKEEVYKDLDRFIHDNDIVNLLKYIENKKMPLKRKSIYFLIRYRKWKLLTFLIKH